MSWGKTAAYNLLRHCDEVYRNCHSSNDMMEAFYNMLSVLDTNKLLNAFMLVKTEEEIENDFLKQMDILCDTHRKVFTLYYVDRKSVEDIRKMRISDLGSIYQVEKCLDRIMIKLTSVADAILFCSDDYAERVRLDRMSVLEKYKNPYNIKLVELNLPTTVERSILYYMIVEGHVNEALYQRITLGDTINSIPDLMELVSCGPSKIGVILDMYESVGINVEKWKSVLSPNILSKIYSKND